LHFNYKAIMYYLRHGIGIPTIGHKDGDKTNWHVDNLIDIGLEYRASSRIASVDIDSPDVVYESMFMENLPARRIKKKDKISIETKEVKEPKIFIETKESKELTLSRAKKEKKEPKIRLINKKVKPLPPLYCLCDTFVVTTTRNSLFETEYRWCIGISDFVQFKDPETYNFINLSYKRVLYYLATGIDTNAFKYKDGDSKNWHVDNLIPQVIISQVPQSELDKLINTLEKFDARVKIDRYYCRSLDFKFAEMRRIANGDQAKAEDDYVYKTFREDEPEQNQYIGMDIDGNSYESEVIEPLSIVDIMAQVINVNESTNRIGDNQE
jgi:hypothetical protein